MLPFGNVQSKASGGRAGLDRHFMRHGGVSNFSLCLPRPCLEVTGLMSAAANSAIDSHVVREYLLSELSPEQLARWSHLAACSLDPNPFLEPEFVLPLQEALSSADQRLVVVENRRTSEWKVAGLFSFDRGCRAFPLPHLSATSSAYTFLDQPLIAGDGYEAALDCWFQTVAHRRDTLGLRFHSVREMSAVSRALEQAAERNGLEQQIDGTWDRAELALSGVSRDGLLEACSKSRRKSLRRARKELESRGRLKFRVAIPFTGDLAAADRFLELEAAGWKGTARTALQADESHMRFFRRMITGFARRRAVWFGELCVGSQVIASTCNVRSGDTLFAFKVGWSPDYAVGSPGLWSEIELADRAPMIDTGLKRIDSCSTTGSHVESVWSDRTRMQAVTYRWSRRARIIARAWQGVRQCKRLLGRLTSRSTGVALQ